MTVCVSVKPSRRTTFDDFYHHRYIPEFLKVVPEIVSARRYAPSNLAQLQADRACFFTIYQLASDDAVASIEDAIARSAHKEVSDQLKRWKEDGLTYFDRAFFEEVYRHPRAPEDGCWSGRPFLTFMWSVRTGCNQAAEWYHNQYLTRLMADVPQWIACRTYQRMDTEPNEYMTVFEVADAFGFDEAENNEQAAYRKTENDTFSTWIKANVDSHAFVRFKQIYRLPD
jgi:hypothetical protein